MNGKNGGSRFQESAAQAGKQFQQSWSDLEHKMSEAIQSSPATSLMVGMGAGLVAGLVIAQLLKGEPTTSQKAVSQFESAKQSAMHLSHNVLDSVKKSLSDALSYLS